MKFKSLCFIVLLSFIFPSMLLSSTEDGDNMNKPLIVFHIDLNSVALKESYIKKWLKKASDMGYNAVLWEVENEIKWQTCPECVSPDAFSKDEFKKLLSYSRSLGLQPIPLLQTVGHAEYVLSHKKYFSFREDTSRYDCYATCKPEVKKFLKDWIKEYLELFGDIKYFHLGGDEAYVFATSPECSAEAKKIGKGKLYAEYMKDISQPLLEKRIRPCIWDDMILHYTDALPVIPKQFVIWDWNYWDGDSTPQKVMLWEKSGYVTKGQVTDEIKKEFPEITDNNGNLRAFYTSDVLKRLGFDVMLCSSSRSHGDAVFAGREPLHASNIIGAAKKVVEDNLLGTCVTSWAVRIPNYETQETWFYLAPLTINNSKLSYDELLSKSCEYTFGVSNTEAEKAFENIGYPFPFVDQSSTGIGWTGMKDSRSAPPGYINSLIEKWKNKNGEKLWKDNISLVQASTEKISEGINELNNFIPKAEKGLDVLEAWKKAAYFQYWGSIIAIEIVNNEESKPVKNKTEILSLLKNLRSDYKNWAKYWMTPTSAETNTGLIYDAIINYFESLHK